MNVAMAALIVLTFSKGFLLKIEHLKINLRLGVYHFQEDNFLVELPRLWQAVEQQQKQLDPLSE